MACSVRWRTVSGVESVAGVSRSSVVRSAFAATLIPSCLLGLALIVGVSLADRHGWRCSCAMVESILWSVRQVRLDKDWMIGLG
jgi:hypothetical protein